MAYGDRWLVGPEDWTAAMKATFIRWGVPDNKVLGYPKLSLELVRRAAPQWIARNYVGVVGEFGKGASDHILINRMQNAWTERWAELDEFTDVPHVRVGFVRFSGRVSERGIAIPITERVSIFSTFAIESIVQSYLSDLIRANIDKDIWENSILWTDFVYAKTNNGFISVKGKAVGAPGNRTSGTTKTFYADAYSTPLSIPMVNFNTDTPGTPQPITSSDLLTVRVEMIRRRMTSIITPVICNPEFEQALLNDSSLQTFFAFQRQEAITRNELGEIRGFLFVVDNTGILDEVLRTINHYAVPGTYNSTSRGFRSIAFFLATDGHRELVALPETVRTDVPVSFQRFNRIGCITYRGEVPMWFYADSQAYKDPTTGQDLPESVRRSSGIVVVAG